MLEKTHLACMIPLEAVDFSPVLAVHLLKFIEVAFRLGDMLDGDITSFGRHGQVGRLVGNSTANRW